ncbi:hypothetical protein F5141DRAFT_1205559, partial [Pisolithus sp. B1]
MTVDFARMYMRTMHIVARSTARVDDSLGIQLHREDGQTGWAYCPIRRGANERGVASLDATASDEPSICNSNPRTALCTLGPEEVANYDHGTGVPASNAQGITRPHVHPAKWSRHCSPMACWGKADHWSDGYPARRSVSLQLYWPSSATSAVIPAHRPHFVHFPIFLTSAPNNITATFTIWRVALETFAHARRPAALRRVYCPSTIWHIESGVSPLHFPPSLKSLQ